MNEQGQLLVDPADYLKITSSKKAFFKGADDSYENVKARVYHDPSVNTDTDDLKISSHVLDFVVDGISFDEQVVKSKAPFTLPYSKKYVEQIFDDKCRISDDLKIEKWKYRTKNEHSAKLVEQMREKKSQLAIADGAKSEEKRKKVQFKPVGYFVDDRKMSLSDGDLTDFKKVCHSNTSKSSENIGGFFLTEINEQVKVAKTKMLREKIVHVENYDWDDFMIDSLSENTARWIVMKQVSDSKRKQKLQALVESKFGRYMRNIDELELGEDSYTEFEKRKMLEEKERVRQEKNPSQR
ncbi:hypothetical protein BpHYR1_000484 [Brachionus plicatilis]|uniref:Uncharacterized protein n=1 Tax=Brachionus plicatilis TaxID=10195 RepID=A0A3M7SX39_BRAPC|nr:hypothetical protein BpHYR1_000484 [Brachionus plicatilis]